MRDLPRVEPVQKGQDIGHQGLQGWVLDAVDALDLPDEKLRVKIDGNCRGPSPQGLLEAEEEGLVFGDIIGAVAEESLRGSYHLTALADEDGPGPAVAGVSTACPVGKKGQAFIRH